PSTSRGRKHELTLVRKPDAGKPHVRFDERGVETERPTNRHRATPRLYFREAGIQPLLDKPGFGRKP
ncbi:MAG TPA: hypothetical protein VIT91_09960, partial [Chthoniobacterales bacterium]